MRKKLASALFVTALFSIPSAAFADNTATGTGTGVLGDSKPINTYFYTSTGKYYLEDHTKPMSGTIATYDFRNGTGNVYYMTDPDNLWTASNQKAAVDANYYAGKVYDFWLTHFNRNSYDDQGSPMISGVHYSTGYNNAYSDGTSAIYGDGDGVTYRSLSGDFDIVAQVWSDTMLPYIAPFMPYQGQSGALMISWADCLAMAISDRNWLIGDDCYTPGVAGDAIRSVENPPLYGQPDHMSQYVNTQNDAGGIHINSGIPNKAFYRFASSGSRVMAAKVWYTAMKDYMPANANFSQARAATLEACAALYGGYTSSAYLALQFAWSSVGIG